MFSFNIYLYVSFGINNNLFVCWEHLHLDLTWTTYTNFVASFLFKCSAVIWKYICVRDNWHMSAVYIYIHEVYFVDQSISCRANCWPIPISLMCWANSFSFLVSETKHRCICLSTRARTKRGNNNRNRNKNNINAKSIEIVQYWLAQKTIDRDENWAALLCVNGGSEAWHTHVLGTLQWRYSTGDWFAELSFKSILQLLTMPQT